MSHAKGADVRLQLDFWTWSCLGLLNHWQRGVFRTGGVRRARATRKIRPQLCSLESRDSEQRDGSSEQEYKEYGESAFTLICRHMWGPVAAFWQPFSSSVPSTEPAACA